MTPLEQRRLQFQPSQWRDGSSALDAVGIRTADRRVFLASSTTFGDGEFAFDEIVSAELNYRFGSRSKTSGGFSLTRFMVGGILTGGAGAIVGGLTGVRKTHTESFLSAVVLKVVTQKGKVRSTHLIDLFRSVEPLTEAGERAAEARCEEILGLLQGAINGPSPSDLEGLGPMPVDFLPQVEWRLRKAGWRVRTEPKKVGQRHVVVLGIRGSDRAAFACLPETVTRYAFDQLANRLAEFSGDAALAVVGKSIVSDVDGGSLAFQVSAIAIEHLDDYHPSKQSDRFGF